MRNQLRAHYLSLANAASQEPEPGAPDWSENYPLDLPDNHGDWDWPDAPRPADAPDWRDPRINDLERTSLEDQRHAAGALIWILGCSAITLASLTYLIWQAL